MGLVSKARALGFGIIIWALAIPIFLFTIFPLVSSTSMGTSGIYLLTYKWNDEQHSWLRLGYYGLCIVNHKDSKMDHCQTTSGRSAKEIADHWQIKDANDFKWPLDLQHNVFVAFLTAGGIIWLISLILISLVILRGPSAGRLIRSTAKVTALAAATLMIASAWATNAAARALEVSSVRSEFKGGVLLYGLQWVGAILAFIYTWACTHVADSDDGGKAYHLGRGV